MPKYVITAFNIDEQWLSSKHFGTLFMFLDKLKLREFSKITLLDCAKYDQLVACFLGKFANTLEKVVIWCCGNDECPILVTLASMLPLCHQLTEVWLGNFNDNKDESLLLNSLKNKSLLDRISLHDFHSTINGEQLAAVCNSAKDHCVCEINLWRTLPDQSPLMRFQLAEFCRSLQPAAAQAIEAIYLEYVECGWVDLLPTLPTIFPNLDHVRLKEFSTNATPEDAGRISRALSGFLHAGAKHPYLTLKLTVACKQEERQFGSWLRDSIDLIDVRRSGTKRTADMEQWKRTLTNGNATVSIKVKDKE